MKIIHTSVEEMAMRRLLIGFEGENQRATVRIDCASVFAEYPNATPTLIVKPLFADAYPVVVDRNGTDVDWLITSEILSFSGDGEIQLVFYKDEVICKSAVSKIRVCRSLQVTGEMPDPVAQWIDDANRKLAEVDAQIVELEGMVDTATDAATRAEQSASTASTKAEQAAGSAATATAKASEATTAAGTATAKAAEAALSATQASNSAMSAADSERGATAKAAEAAQSAQTAAQKAEQITEAAQIATGKAGEASASATSAQASATDAASSATAASVSETAAKASETAASTSATQAGTSERNAGTAAQTATQKAAEASQSATDAETFAGTATTKAEEAAASAQAASDAKTAVEQTAEQLADSLEQIEQNTQDIAELDERKANIDGYYPDMTVGNAEQLNSSKFVENSEPYTLRTSGGSSDIGNREYLDAVVGGTLAWNQLVNVVQGSGTNGGIAYEKNANGKVTLNGTVQGIANINISGNNTITVVKDHVYIPLVGNLKARSSGDLIMVNAWKSTFEFGSIKKCFASTTGVVSIRFDSGITLSGDYYVQLFDLTQMFGRAVADYLYNLETATAGAGLALFRSWFPNDYYEYNPGELRHVEGLQSHDMVGFNQWDEEWELGTINSSTGENAPNDTMIRSKNHVPVVPGAGYYLNTHQNLGVARYGVDKTFISLTQGVHDTILTIPNNVYFIRFYVNPAYGTTYKHDICINLSHNASRNGEYEPYTKHSYPLDSTVVLRGIPKVGANGVYRDGDRYLPDGTVERRYGVVDLGSLTWGYYATGYAHPFFYATLPSQSITDALNMLTAKGYTPKTFTDMILNNKSVSIANNNSVRIRDDSFADAAAFKAAMSGVLLVYELATPTTETAQPYHSTQWVSDWGTEEFVSTGIVPVGHETRYPANLRDKLQHLPDAASGNGSYLITQTDGQMVLTPFPAPPSTAGNYVLKATVTGGVATYTWEVAT